MMIHDKDDGGIPSHVGVAEITADQGTVPLAIRQLRIVSWSSPALVPMVTLKFLGVLLLGS